MFLLARTHLEEAVGNKKLTETDRNLHRTKARALLSEIEHSENEFTDRARRLKIQTMAAVACSMQDRVAHEVRGPVRPRPVRGVPDDAGPDRRASGSPQEDARPQDAPGRRAKGPLAERKKLEAGWRR